MASHCCLNFHFCNDIRCGASFHVLIFHLCFLFGKVSRSLPHFLIGLSSSMLLTFNNSLYILDNNHLSDCLFKYLLLTCGFSFHSLDSVFCSAEVFNVNEVQFIDSFLHGSCLCCLFLWWIWIVDGVSVNAHAVSFQLSPLVSKGYNTASYKLCSSKLSSLVKNRCPSVSAQQQLRVES